MHSTVVAVLALLALFAESIWAFPSGAPIGACARIFPVGHGGSSQDLATIPYTLDISAFGSGYVPGQTYTLTLSGTVQFRGLLVQARSMADDSPVGSFTADDGGVTRLSSCDRADSAITHTSRSDKTSVDLSFTAPTAGTGPLRFRFAVVRTFSTYYAPVETAVISEQTIEPPTSPEVELNFIGDTPIVTGNDVTVQLSVSPSLPLRCEMITRDAETEMPVIIDTINCTSGSATFTNVENGRHRIRVIAGEREAVIRSRIVIMQDTPNFCSLNAINNGITEILDSNGTLTSYRIEFRPIGEDVGFICFINRGRESVNCASPFEIPATDDLESVKVVPNPSRCLGRRKPLVFRLGK